MSLRYKLINQTNKQHLIFIGLCILLGGLLLWRCVFGLDLADESFYAATTNRFYLGDAMMIDEWWPTQLVGFIQLPFFAITRLLLGSTEGILLALRYQYIVFQLAVVIICYWKLRKRGMLSMLPGFLYLLSTPFNINAMSYNTLGIAFLLLTVVLLSASEKPSGLDYLFAGVCIACTILSNPFAILIYILYAACSVISSIVCLILKKQAMNQLKFKNFLLLTLGAFIIFCLFVIFIFSRGTLNECLANLPHILNASGHEQNQSSIFLKFKTFYEFLMTDYGYLIKIMAVIIVVTIIDWKREAHAWFYFIPTVLVVGTYIVYYGFLWEHIPTNYVYVPLAFLGFESFFLLKKKPIELFLFWTIPGLLYSLCVHLASNTGILAISSSYLILSAGGMLFTALLLKEKWEGKRKKEFAALAVMATLVFVIQFSASLYLRTTYIWSDHPATIANLTAKIERGPAKGIYTTPEKAEYYNGILDDIDTVALTDKDNFLVINLAPWLYLYTDVPYACPHAWEIKGNDTTLFDYYVLHPDKFPSVIYFVNTSEGGMEQQAFIMNLMENGYSMQPLQKGVVFTR